MMNTKKLSVILPSCNEEAALPHTARALAATLGGAGIPYELIFVDDGSRDGTWERITAAAAENPRIRGIRFSRNFGKEAAIFAGLAAAEGACAAVMDCDLQHPPETLLEMYAMWTEGCQVVEGVKRSRGQESLAHRVGVGAFYGIMSRITETDMSRASDFKLLDRRAVQAVLSMPERNSFFRVMSSWVGFRTGSVEFDVQEREAGESKWSTPALIRYAVNSILEYTAKPLRFVVWAGALTLLAAALLGLRCLLGALRGQAASDYALLSLLLLLLGGLLMLSLGIMGEYIAKIYDEVKGRPRYIISQLTETDRTP